MIGWQEIITVALVAAAAFVIFRRVAGKSGAAGCGGCQSPRPAQGLKITEIHQVTMDKQLPAPEKEE